MDTLDAIKNRRSIRRFKPDPIPDDVIITLLEAAMEAPSGKNRQPWEFVVVKEDQRAEILEVMGQGILKSKELRGNVGSAENTLRIMQQTPVTIFIFNPFGKVPWEPLSIEDRIMEIVDVQSIGASIQNMLLAAAHLNIGSLWICDVFFAYEELCTLMNRQDAMIAAISFGYTDEKPDRRPRKTMDEVVRWGI